MIGERELNEMLGTITVQKTTLPAAPDFMAEVRTKIMLKETTNVSDTHFARINMERRMGSSITAI